MKQNIILLHGALGSKAQLESLKKALSSDFEAYAFDFEGHGANAASGNYSMSAFAENLQHFMTENGIEKSSLFGYSMGGYVALTFAKNHSEQVEKIVTLGTKFHWTPESAADETQKLNPDKIEEKVPAFAASLAETHGKEHWKNVVSKTAEMMTELGNGKTFRNEDFSCIQINTLLLLAEHDTMVSLAETELVQIALPNAEFQILPDAKHPMETADSNKLADIITEFILQ